MQNILKYKAYRRLST